MSDVEKARQAAELKVLSDVSRREALDAYRDAVAAEARRQALAEAARICENAPWLDTTAVKGWETLAEYFAFLVRARARVPKVPTQET